MRILATLLLLLASSLASSESNVDEDGETTAILGEWRVVSLESRGKADSGVSFRGMRYSFDKETWTTSVGDTTPAGISGKPPLKAKYTIDDSKVPKQLDMILTKGETSITKKAIYKIEDDKLHICLGRTERPTSFDTKDEDSLCYIAERVVAGPEKSQP